MQKKKKKVVNYYILTPNTLNSGIISKIFNGKTIYTHNETKKLQHIFISWYISHLKQITKTKKLVLKSCTKNIVSFSIFSISSCVKLFFCNIGCRLCKRALNFVK